MSERPVTRSRSKSSTTKPASQKKRRSTKKAKVAKPAQGSGEYNSDGEEIFYVDKILAHKGRGRGRRYLVQWYNYGPEHNSWEPTGNFDDPTFVKNYEAELLKKQEEEEEEEAAELDGDDMEMDEEDEEDESLLEEEEKQQSKKAKETRGFSLPSDLLYQPTKKVKSIRELEKRVIPVDVGLQRHKSSTLWMPGKAVCSLLHVPHDVIRARILPYLWWEDARSLSRVCVYLSKDAQWRMTEVARAEFGEDLRAPKVMEEYELNRAMACVVAYGDRQFSKAAAMREFCLSDTGARNMSMEAAGGMYRRPTFSIFAVIRHSLKRFGTLTNMLEYKKSLLEKRQEKASLRDRFSDRRAAVDRILAERGHPAFNQISYACPGQHPVARWISTGVGRGDVFIERLLENLERRKIEATRLSEISALFEQHKIEVVRMSWSFRRFGLPMDPILLLQDEYVHDFFMGTEETLQRAKAMYELRQVRSAHIEELMAPSGYSVDALKNEGWHKDRRTDWPRRDALEALEMHRLRYAMTGSPMCGLRALEEAHKELIYAVKGPLAEEMVVERGLRICEGGFMTLPVSLQDVIVDEAMQLRRAQFDPAAVVPQDGNLDAPREIPAIMRERALPLCPTVEEVAGIIERHALLRKARLEHLLELLQLFEPNPDLALAFLPRGVTLEQYLSVGETLDQLILYHLHELRKERSRTEEFMLGMLELAGEDLESLPAVVGHSVRAYVDLVPKEHILAGMLLRGFVLKRLPEDDPDVLLVELHNRKSEKFPGSSPFETVRGRPHAWHDDKLDRVVLWTPPPSNPTLSFRRDGRLGPELFLSEERYHNALEFAYGPTVNFYSEARVYSGTLANTQLGIGFLPPIEDNFGSGVTYPRDVDPEAEARAALEPDVPDAMAMRGYFGNMYGLNLPVDFMAGLLMHYGDGSSSDDDGGW